MNRVINIDWLEIYCFEPTSFSRFGDNSKECLEYNGFIVKQREYGTPVYEQVLFVSFSEHPDLVVFEIRRVPRTNSKGGQFIAPNSCHIRVTNRFCYLPDCIELLRCFIEFMEYTFVQIRRIDLCLDFNRFDNGELPDNFVMNFLANKYLKINQCNIALHGADGWDGRKFNSLKWGSARSNITTKLYNKSYEMQCRLPKQYIQDCWKEGGLDTSRDIWRVEFSINAGRKGYKNVKTQQFYKMKLSDFENKEQLLFVFHMLVNEYFHFKYNEGKRKDRCKDKVLFIVSADEKVFRPKDIPMKKDENRTDKIIMKRLFKYYEDTDKPEDIKKASYIVANYLYNNIKSYIGYNISPVQ